MDTPNIEPVSPFMDLHGACFSTILADPPWLFLNKTGKIAPEHRRLFRYDTMALDEIKALPVEHLAATPAHLYLWCPNALLPDGLAVMAAWGFTYKTYRLLLPQRDRAGPVRYARPERPHARAGTAAGQPAGDAQTRAQPKTQRTISHHRSVQFAAIPRTVCARHARRVGIVGR